MRGQVLDSMDLERERGITIKARAVRVYYEAKDGKTYQLPHRHARARRLRLRGVAVADACEGALLVVDASQGVEAQTVANTYLAVEAGLELIPCLNKIDLPGAEPERVAGEISKLIGDVADSILVISARPARASLGCSSGWSSACRRPRASPTPRARADLRLAVRPVPRRRGLRPRRRRRVPQGRGDPRYCHVGRGRRRRHRLLCPGMTPATELAAGEVGYLITGIKDVTKLQVGDTLTTKRSGAAEPLPGYREVKPMVFCGLFPIDER